ncbi:MAG: GNAT family N-acetyltransferase [Thermoplasmata archaeon]
MGEEWVVEELSPSDARDIENLFKIVWAKATEYPEEWRKRRMLSAKEIIEEMERGYRFFGIRLGERIVGVYKARIRGDACYGEHQSIHPRCRAAGLAKAMYDQFLDFARKTNCGKNVVNILIGHQISERCVRRYAFHKVGEPFEQCEGMLVQRYEREV